MSARSPAYDRRWEVSLHGKILGVVRGATQQAACLRAVNVFKIQNVEDQRELVLRRITSEEVAKL
jgi:hypothetical protein